MRSRKPGHPGQPGSYEEALSMLLSTFRGKETSKMVSSTFLLESEMLDNFQVTFFQHD